MPWSQFYRPTAALELASRVAGKLHDAKNRRQAQPCPFATLVGPEKRLAVKDLLEATQSDQQLCTAVGARGRAARPAVYVVNRRVAGWSPEAPILSIR